MRLGESGRMPINQRQQVGSDAKSRFIAAILLPFGSSLRLSNYRRRVAAFCSIWRRIGSSMGREAHGRSTFAMIFSQLCRRARQGQGIASAFGTPVHRGCNDSVVADYRRIPSGSRGGARAGARLGARM
jgi:hypothetical protein